MLSALSLQWTISFFARWVRCIVLGTTNIREASLGTNRQTQRQTDRQTDKHTDRPTKYTCLLRVNEKSYASHLAMDINCAHIYVGDRF